MFKSINILTSAFICFGIKHLKLKMPMRQGIITPQCWSLTNEIAGRLNAQKFINTEVPQKYWNEAVTVIKTHNGGNRSNNILGYSFTCKTVYHSILCVVQCSVRTAGWCWGRDNIQVWGQHLHRGHLPRPSRGISRWRGRFVLLKVS